MEPESRRNAQSKTVLVSRYDWRVYSSSKEHRQDLVQRTNISFLYGVIYWDLQGSFRLGGKSNYLVMYEQFSYDL